MHALPALLETDREDDQRNYGHEQLQVNKKRYTCEIGRAKEVLAEGVVHETKTWVDPGLAIEQPLQKTEKWRDAAGKVIERRSERVEALRVPVLVGDAGRQLQCVKTRGASEGPGARRAEFVAWYSDAVPGRVVRSNIAEVNAAGESVRIRTLVLDYEALV